MRGADTSRRSRCPRLGAEFANIPPRRGIAHLAGRGLNIARLPIKISVLHTQRSTILRAELTHKGLVAIGRLAAQMMVYMQHVQSFARDGSYTTPILNIQL